MSEQAMRCSRCGHEAIIYQRYSGAHLCRRHFIADFEARAKRAIRTHGWIRANDRIAVALSGGKDSSALLHFLATRFGARRDMEIMAITVDEGIRGYRDPERARGIAERYGVECLVTRFRDAYGYDIDQILERVGTERSCTFCGVLRRRLLNKTARELGATKLALGFNLDDDAQSVLMNVLRGDSERLLRPDVPVEGLVPRIRPFLHIPEREVALYACLNVEGFSDRGCPYAHNALRADVRIMLNDYHYRHPSTKFALVNLGEELAEVGGAAAPELKVCGRCGEPYFERCRACELLREANLA
ncbi:MAG: ATP-binding protein [Methanomicrobiaceae archaeon]|nr:ATP-binding protein [Methanomicrobiaceae archaeon]